MPALSAITAPMERLGAAEVEGVGGGVARADGAASGVAPGRRCRRVTPQPAAWRRGTLQDLDTVVVRAEQESSREQAAEQLHSDVQLPCAGAVACATLLGLPRCRRCCRRRSVSAHRPRRRGRRRRRAAMPAGASPPVADARRPACICCLAVVRQR